MVLDLLPPGLWLFAAATAFAGGFVKGAVGFAMPLIMISVMSILIDPRLALAGLILPTLTSNLLQIGRAGRDETREALRAFWHYILASCLMVFVTAQIVSAISDRAMYLALGVPVTLMAGLQMTGVRFRVPARARPLADILVGAVAGAIGGISGVWGPPLVLYLLALDVPRARHMAVQGLAYSLGSLTLFVGHLRSGLLNAETLPFSAALLIPAWIGMWAGFRAGDRLDPRLFRRLTLAVLVLAGLNLLRRGLAG